MFGKRRKEKRELQKELIKKGFSQDYLYSKSLEDLCAMKKLAGKGTIPKDIEIIRNINSQIKQKYGEEIEYAFVIWDMMYPKTLLDRLDLFDLGGRSGGSNPVMAFTRSRIIFFGGDDQLGVFDWGRIGDFTVEKGLSIETGTSVVAKKGEQEIELGLFSNREFSFERLQYELQKKISLYLKNFYRTELLKETPISESELEKIVADSFVSTPQSLKINVNIDKSTTISIKDSVVHRSEIGGS